MYFQTAPLLEIWHQEGKWESGHRDDRVQWRLRPQFSLASAPKAYRKGQSAIGIGAIELRWCFFGRTASASPLAANITALRGRSRSGHGSVRFYESRMTLELDVT